MNTRTRVLTAAVGVLTISAATLAPSATAGGTPSGPFITLTSKKTVYITNSDLSTLVTWEAVDEHGVDSFRTFLQMKPYDQPFYESAAVTTMFPPSGTFVEDDQLLSAGPGWSGCLAITGEDELGNPGFLGFENTPCFATPVDDPLIVKSSGWKEKFARGNYLNTISSTKRQGASMSFRSGHFTHLAVVAVKGPGHGKIRITDEEGFIDKTVSLAAAEMKKKVVIKIPVQEGITETQPDNSVAIRVVSKDKPVKIDGVAALDRRILV